MIQSYFDNIESIISALLSFAEQRVYVAVAWFTNKRLSEELINALKRNVKVKVLLLNDILNRSEFGIDFGALATNGAEIRFANSKIGTMHNKFCIIDDKVITGSYNWTYHANVNNENIIEIDEVGVVNRYCKQFEVLFNSGEPIKHPYVYLKWTEVKEGDFSELRRNLFRDIIANGTEYRELQKSKLIKLDQAYKSGNAEELANAALLPIEHRFRTITDVLTSPTRRYKGGFFNLRYWDLDEQPADVRFSTVDKWIFIPEQFIEDINHDKYVRGYLHYYKWYKNRKFVYERIKIDIYDSVFVSSLSKYLKDDMDISNIPEELICIDQAKLSIYKYSVESIVSDTQQIQAIAVFCLVKEIKMDNIVYYDGWDPKSRGKSIVERSSFNQP